MAVMGRLCPGWTLKRASAWLDAISPGIFDATALTGYSTETVETYKRFRLAAHAASEGQLAPHAVRLVAATPAGDHGSGAANCVREPGRDGCW